MNLALFIIAGFVGMEIISYLVHRFVFHGLLWNIHRTHHEASHGHFELNDLFSLGFAAVAIVLVVLGSSDPLVDPRFGVGIGITVYGILYFIMHDLFTHRRFLPFSSESRIMLLIRSAHNRHHQTAEKDGHEPYGLFLFPYDRYKEAATKKAQRVKKHSR
jgi:beta-carotene 3-hydroxylase